MSPKRIPAAAFIALIWSSAPLAAQTPAKDPSERLREVLPADVAERVLAKISEARARELPAVALEHRALKFAAKGVEPRDIERSVAEHAERMDQARSALEAPRGRRANDEEIEAGAELMRRGVGDAELSELAATAPSGRSLAVPLYVIGSLIDRGLPSDEALQRVNERLAARAADAEIERLPGELPPQAEAGQAHKPALTGQDLAATKRPETAGATPGVRAVGPPVSVPANAGKGTRPTPPPKPKTPPRRGGGGGI
jgi:hypothetical protein